MIILLYGDDTYRSRERLRTLRDAFCEKYDPSGINIIHADGESLTAEALVNHLSVQGFLTAKRLIIIEQFLTRGRAAEQHAVFDALSASHFATDNIVLFWESGEMPKAGGAKKGSFGATLWKAIADVAKVERFAPLEGAPLTAWYTKEIQKRGGAIEKPALQHLIHLVGGDLWHASAEIEKLIHYSNGQPITEATIDLLIATPFDENIFELTDAIGQRETATALRLLENQFQNGAEPLYLLRMLAWHTRNLIAVRSFLNDGISNPRTIARDLKLHPFVAQKAIRQVAAFSLDDLKMLYRGLLEIDQSIKSRPIDPRVLFTLLTVKLAPPRSGVTRPSSPARSNAS